MTSALPARPPSWKWWVCGLLLLASAINYMDRQTLANAAVRITTQFQLSQEQYGNLELAFGWAFAAGSLVFGFAADRLPVRWVYPAVLATWSVTGFATGLVRGYDELLLCRTCLGFFEAGHWPCAIKTTQRLLEPQDRSMGNSVLQSGASMGAIITPLLMRALLTDNIESWRFSFQVIGLGGLVWLVAWFAFVGKGDLKGPPAQAASASTEAAQGTDIWRVIFSRRMLVILIVVALINTAWQLLRAWLPKFLQEGRGYSEATALNFNSLFFMASDVGCLGAGALTLWLHRRGASVHGARCVAFLVSSLLAASALIAAFLPRGWLLLGLLLLAGAGTLGVFPIYHAFTQDLTRYHQGMVTGLAGVAAWAPSLAQKFYGRLVDQTGSFDLGLAIASCFPLAAFGALWLLWPRAAPNGGSSSASAGGPASKR